SAGASVACIDLAPAAKAPAACSSGVVLGDVDLDSPTAAAVAFRSAAERLGGLDGVVNIAGGFRWQKIEDGDIGTWDPLYHLNVRTAVNAIRAALPLLTRHGGRIVNTGAAAAIK